jgi:hypothetical protein
MVFSLSGAVVPTRGRRATLPARPPRPPAAAARDLQSPRRAQEVCVACKLFLFELFFYLPIGRANTRGGDGV